MDTTKPRPDESAKVSIQPPRGTHDILPSESFKWQKLEDIMRKIVQQAGYQEIRLPIFEHTELFKRGVGETTDIVNKEMYTFEDRSQRSLTLRPEGTAGVVRAYLTHGMSRQTPPVKLWYTGPMFRYERSQTGRYRQFHQIGVEVFGSEGPAIDAEVIVLAVDCLNAIGVQSYTVELNSIGCTVCRPAFKEKLKAAIKPHLAEMCEDCKERFERNPLRMLDCKNETCRQFFKELPSSLESLCADCKAHFDGLGVLLAAASVTTKINERLVRGLDYYGRTVFEITVDDPRLGAQSTVLAGGRYDYLVESLGGPKTPAVGWAAGMERLNLLVENDAGGTAQAFVVCSDMKEAFALATQLRRAGLACELDFPPAGNVARAFKRQIERASKSGARFALILGDQELAEGKISVKDLGQQSQETIARTELVDYLKNKSRNGV